MNNSILWIEDDFYHVRGLVKPLEKDGYKITIARSVIEAKEHLINWQDFSAILLDLIIPYSGGFL
jgi:DNA-binding response OmpR family regulator